MATLSALLVSILVLGSTAATPASQAVPPRPAVSVWNYEHLVAARDSLKKGKGTYREPFQTLRREAEKLCKETPGSVMDKPDDRMANSGDKHDFYSVGKYCWPNPDTPDGMPWIQRDGYINRENYRLDDAVRQNKMCDRVAKLSLAYFFTGEDRFAAKAVEAARVWFLDPATRMNPHLNFAQVIPGRDGGRGHVAGVIFGRVFVDLLAGLSLIRNSPAYTSEFDAGIRKWFAEYDHWLTTSEFGQKEAKATNNHSIAYDQQRLAIALFLGDAATAGKIVQEFHPRRIFPQVEPDGKMPRELARTRGLGYSAYNVIHMLEMCEMASSIAPALYDEKSADGRCIGAAVDCIAGYLGKTVDDFAPYKQISDWDDCLTQIAWIVKWAGRWDPAKDYHALFQKHAAHLVKDVRLLLY